MVKKKINGQPPEKTPLPSEVSSKISSEYSIPPLVVQGKKTKEERAVFATEVAKKRMDGMSFNNIAKHFGCAKATAHSAYRQFMVDFHKHHMSLQRVLLAEYHARQERIYNQMLGAYSESVPEGKKTGKIVYLEKASQLLTNSFDRLQSAGLLPKVTDKVQIEGTQPIKIEITTNKEPASTPKKKKGESK